MSEGCVSGAPTDPPPENGFSVIARIWCARRLRIRRHLSLVQHRPVARSTEKRVKSRTSRPAFSLPAGFKGGVPTAGLRGPACPVYREPELQGYFPAASSPWGHQLISVVYGEVVASEEGHG